MVGASINNDWSAALWREEEEAGGGGCLLLLMRTRYR